MIKLWQCSAGTEFKVPFYLSMQTLSEHNNAWMILSDLHSGKSTSIIKLSHPCCNLTARC